MQTLRRIANTCAFAVFGSLAVLGLSAAEGGDTAQPAEVLRRVPVGPNPESIARGFGDKFLVTLLGGRREKGDRDGKIVLLDGARVVPFADGFDDPKGLAYTGTELITVDFDTVWGVDPLGRKRLIAGPKDFPEKARALNGVALMPDNDGVWVSGAAGEEGRVYGVVVEGVVKVMIGGAACVRAPRGISFSGETDLFVCDAATGALLEWKGGAWRRIPGEFPGIEGIVQDRRGRVYVTERDSGRVWLVDPKEGKRVLLATLRSAGNPAVNDEAGELAVPDTKAGEIVFLRMPR